ncbi:MAG: YeeE/YedE family protein [Gemmatimonadetes bacterium]|nr:YeeE/YedE family protein [Gemmatimonadota bacterium]NNM03619.1 YeeE/YedE family protein [Gemmatimonadota bacterium]
MKTSIPEERRISLLFHLITGTILGVLFVKGEVISWFRIQEMFRLQSIHMYGTIGSAVLVGAISIGIIKGFKLRSIRGEPILIEPKERTPALRRYWIGGIIFGVGWALLGACPGPMFTLTGGGVWVYSVAIASAVAGTGAYASLRKRLPH